MTPQWQTPTRARRAVCRRNSPPGLDADDGEAPVHRADVIDLRAIRVREVIDPEKDTAPPVDPPRDLRVELDARGIIDEKRARGRARAFPEYGGVVRELVVIA